MYKKEKEKKPFQKEVGQEEVLAVHLREKKSIKKQKEKREKEKKREKELP